MLTVSASSSTSISMNLPCASFTRSESRALARSAAVSSSHSRALCCVNNSESFQKKRHLVILRATASDAVTVPPIDDPTSSSSSLAPAITLSEKALVHLTRLRDAQGKALLLRVGVRQGGCSGYSYTMDFEDRSNVKPEDSVMSHSGFEIVCDPKSLLFLYGLQLDYSDALIGGGFSFQNPNAASSCGCGKSFAA